jgi:hypothetical protein
LGQLQVQGESVGDKGNAKLKQALLVVMQKILGGHAVEKPIRRPSSVNALLPLPQMAQH